MSELNINYFYSDSGPERGGIITTNKSLVELKNVNDNPMEGFSLSEDDLSLLEEPCVLGTFHTHPGGSSNLSVSDYLTFKNYPRLQHYICGKDGIKCFITRGGILVEKS